MTELSELRLSVVMPAPPEAVHAALTDAAALRVWLTEHAEVALPDRYEFWGRFTPDGAEPHQRVLHAGERNLRFAWTVDGSETTVEFTLTENEPEHDAEHEDAGGTLLTLTQSGDLPSFDEILADTAGPRGELETFWSLAIANLADYLSGRELTPKCDYTSAELRASVVIDAAPEAVFDSLTQPEQFRKWFGATSTSSPMWAAGSRWAASSWTPGGSSSSSSSRAARRPCGSPTAKPTAGSWRARTARPGSRSCRAGSTGQPAVLGLGRLAQWRRRAAALPRGAAWRTIWRQIEAPGVPPGMLSIDV